MRFIPALLVALSVIPAQAQILDGRQEYRSCLTQAKQKPEQGWEEAITWQSLGGGEAARHCAAVALIGLGKYGEAAWRLETLANESVRDDNTRAEMLAQAAQAWQLGGNLQRADAAQRVALSISPDNPDILLDHAVLLAQVNHYQDSIDILSRVLRLQPNRIEALVLRAAAFRRLENLPGAEDDLNNALKLDPNYPDALLERGMIRRIKGDDSAARQDWLRAIELAPESPAADTARGNLEKMDVKVK